MKFSIVVPSFNHAAYLEACLVSILNERKAGREIELVVMDGGSTDGSVDIIREYESEIAHWVSRPDGGQTRALVEGFRHTTGEVMAWLNSDDLYLPGALAQVERELEHNPAHDVVFGDMLWLRPDGELLRPQREIAFDLSLLLWCHNYIPQPSTFWRRRIWDRTTGLDPSFECAMDFDLWLKFHRAGGRFLHTPKPLSAMRTYPEQKNRRLRHISDAEDLALISRQLGYKPTRFERAAKKLVFKSVRVARRLGVR